MHPTDPAVDTVESDVVGASHQYCPASVGQLDFRPIELMILEGDFGWSNESEQRVRGGDERSQHVKQQSIAYKLAAMEGHADRCCWRCDAQSVHRSEKFPFQPGEAAVTLRKLPK
jgi:hypothetical protein